MNLKIQKNLKHEKIFRNERLDLLQDKIGDDYMSKGKTNKVRAKLIVDIEAEYYDDESSEETLRYCVEQDLEDAGFNVVDVSVIE